MAAELANSQRTHNLCWDETGCFVAFPIFTSPYDSRLLHRLVAFCFFYLNSSCRGAWHFLTVLFPTVPAASWSCVDLLLGLGFPPLTSLAVTLHLWCTFLQGMEGKASSQVRSGVVHLLGAMLLVPSQGPWVVTSVDHGHTVYRSSLRVKSSVMSTWQRVSPTTLPWM